ncbi:MAG: ATP-binding cassette domain-containing protein [Bacteroidetes bacterium]|nr:ATP-binding cassette domain-containing protein [Bacteroidota bacterium]
MNTVIEAVGLTKQFGKKTAVNKIDFKVNRGEVFGLLGPNGSGKTTTLSMMLTLLKPTSGSIQLFGSNDLTSALKRIGVLLESANYYPELSAEKNLLITSHIKGVDTKKIDEVLEKTGLTENKRNKVKTFSLGMKQRLSIAAALMSDPELMIFDEPTNGLDPQGIAEMRHLIGELAKEGKTILIASHLLSEMEKICTHIAILKNGVILEQGELKTLMQEHGSLEEYFLSKTK